ncbi:UDP-glucose dehydrogenase family protein [Sporolactobacillus terrae]|uniref:UDP-glucose 6-dehydrogenase n=1 Tax=Sporolactobacillus terrae TaxID=269673 RepID=A0A410D6M8_9BACL|nr:UDP-glucose/GDP-mannose dehydrogenase family protein [Sporolactobacillus terrae]QAA21736.1 UDP-glucose 6-dehydrogenase [Sporolactobacillus terrae]QAA24708.1 UDP-glucose 6-dehydrogenase [Sporolactobacillus terrae]UAK16539.1 UDP-glucose/GDP-mannose dehydrogenase family protein [Sporolactobacillus terrae]BBN98003.1 UDP-glucose 6-dehydrogenase YwqF [Sporolactobacillus terrae]
MKIAVIGTGYVGLVTGVALAEIGHTVTCIDVDPKKVEALNQGVPTIYEPGLGEMMLRNQKQNRLFFTDQHKLGLADAAVVYLAVGTPQNTDGSANLSYVERAAVEVAEQIDHPVVVVIKSTVPVGTNLRIKRLMMRRIRPGVFIRIASNPEFLREGSAIHDTFHGDRMIIGTEDEATASLLAEINEPFGIPIVKTDLFSSEMIKYASNAFLATKISFINEIANLCEKLGANVEEVAKGMGMDHRIGSAFLRAGIGYGGSCFPKDTNALVQLAGNHHHTFNLLKSVIEVNNQQHRLLIDKILERFGSINGKKVAVLGLAFKPNTDDLRESPALVMIPQLAALGADVIGYDPIAADRGTKWISAPARYTNHVAEALDGADFAVIITDWPDIKRMDPETYVRLMDQPIVFDGRNCYSIAAAREANLEYYSIGRPNVVPEVSK